MSYQKFVKDIGILGLTQLITALSGFVILPVITKLLGAEHYGVWTQLMVTIGLIGPVAVLGLPYTLIRFLAGEKNKKEIQDGIWSVATLIFGVSAIFSLFLIFFADPVSKFFSCEKIFVQILAIIIIFDYLNQVLLSVFRAFQQNLKFCIFQIFQKLGESGLVIAAIYLGHGLFGAVASLLIIRAIIFLLMSSFIIKEFGFKIPQFLKIKEYLSFGLPTISNNLSWWIIDSSDRYLIGFFLGTLFVGYYNPAYVVGLFVMNFLVAPFSFLLPAILYKFYDENKVNEVKIYLKYSLKYFLMLGIPSVFGLSILSKQILTILTTPEFAQAGYLVMPIVALGMLPMGANAIISHVFGIAKKTNIGGALAIAAALLNFGLNLIFIPRFGLAGAALTTLVAFTFSFLSTWIYSSRHIRLEVDWQFIFKSTSASVLMAFFVFWLNPSGIYKTIMAIAFGVLIYSVFIFLFKGLSKKEIEFFKKFLRDLISPLRLPV